MPIFILFTNLPKSSVPGGFMKDLSKAIATAIRKPETFVTIRVHTDQMMLHGGSDELCANSELQSIGHMSEQENKEMSEQIGKFLKEKLGIQPTRNYIKFTNMERMDIGYNHTTFTFLELPTNQ